MVEKRTGTVICPIYVKLPFPYISCEAHSKKSAEFSTQRYPFAIAEYQYLVLRYL